MNIAKNPCQNCNHKAILIKVGGKMKDLLSG